MRSEEEHVLLLLLLLRLSSLGEGRRRRRSRRKRRRGMRRKRRKRRRRIRMKRRRRRRRAGGGPPVAGCLALWPSSGVEAETVSGVSSAVSSVAPGRVLQCSAGRAHRRAPLWGEMSEHWAARARLRAQTS